MRGAGLDLAIPPMAPNLSHPFRGMTTMRFRPLALLMTATLAVGAAETPVQPGSPEATVAIPAQALRSNDLISLFKTVPAEKQAQMREAWKQAAVNATAQDKAEFDEKFGMLLEDGAVDRLMMMVEPQLKQMNLAELAGGVQMVGGMLAMQVAQKDQAMGQTLQQFAMDLAQWLPESKLDDPVIMRKALTAVCTAAKAMGAKNSDEMLALPLDEFLTRLGGAVKEAKQAFTAYGIDVDGFLDSVALSNVQGTGERRTAELGMTLFGKPYRFPVTLVQDASGTWTFDGSQLEQMAPMMPFGGGEM